MFTSFVGNASSEPSNIVLGLGFFDGNETSGQTWVVLDRPNTWQVDERGNTYQITGRINTWEATP